MDIAEDSMLKGYNFSLEEYRTAVICYANAIITFIYFPTCQVKCHLPFDIRLNLHLLRSLFTSMIFVFATLFG
jgi:hypothetical protein